MFNNAHLIHLHKHSSSTDSKQINDKHPHSLQLDAHDLPKTLKNFASTPAFRHAYTKTQHNW